MITLERDGRVAVLTLDRPPANAFDEDQVDRLDRCVDQVRATEDCRALLVRGSGRMFSAGADIGAIGSRLDGPDGADRMAAFTARLQQVYSRLEACEVPTVAAIHGAATGGGLELALACDIRIAASDAKIGLPELAIGLIPGAGGTQRLTRAAGRGAAMRIILGAELVDGAEAQRLGIVHWSVPAAELIITAAQVAARLAEQPSPAVAAAKRCIGLAEAPAAGFAAEVEAIRDLIKTPEARDLVHAFLARRGEDRRES